MRNHLGHFLTGNPLRRPIMPRVRRRSDAKRLCTHCTHPRVRADFARHAASPDGLRPECNVCRNERRRALRAGALRVRPWGLVR
jgi:hypothetical protein